MKTEGPAAPKDPEKKRPFFYIMREKEIFGSIQPDGRGIQFIYEDSGRLINSAQIVGNIVDPEILDLLKETQGFRRLVHSIGVSVETENPEEKIDFVFQMYGKEDALGGGSNLRCSLLGDGAEVRLRLEDITWSADDKEPGQIRFEFETPQLLAAASVRFFLNDGFDAPEVIEEEDIDFHSGDYQKMLERSLMNMGNTARFLKAVQKAKSGEDVTIAYIGGSITQGAGATPIHHECYAYKSYQAFAELFGNGNNVHFIKAGVGGTPSELGMVRFERDVLRDGSAAPDIIVIEFAVNDEGDETQGNCYESLVRKALKLPQKPAVILLFSVFANDWNLQERLGKVGYHYNLPMVSVLDAVTPQFKLKSGAGRVLSKNQFFYDMFHPTNHGHTIMADCLTYFFRQAVQKEPEDDDTEQLLLQDAVIGCDFEAVKLLDRKDSCDRKEIVKLINCGSFLSEDKDLQCVEMDEELTGTPEFPYNWMYCGKVENEEDYFELKIYCKALLLIYKDSGDMAVGKADVILDGKKILTADPHVNGWTHCNPVILFQQKEAEEHVVRIHMAQGDEDKRFTILGFGYVE